MAYKTAQLSIKQLDLLVNEDHTLVLDTVKDYYALSFTLIYLRTDKTSTNTVLVNTMLI